MGEVKDLKAYQQAYALCLLIYKATAGFPPDERYGLISQMRRAASSVGANLAEGSKQRSDRDNARFVGMAVGSLEELRHFLRLSCDLGYLPKQQAIQFNEQCETTVRMLYGLKKFLSQGA